MTSRRRFLTHSCSFGAGALVAPGLLGTLGAARTALAADLEGYRALVCILLAGGNDSYNMLVPWDADQYGAYAAIRSDLALSHDVLLPLAGTTSSGRRYAVHPGLGDVQQLYAAGELAVIANVGTLLEPVDAAAIAAGASVPLGLFSHSDQIAQWQTAVPDARLAQGWGGRIADLFEDVNPANGISMSLSLSGSNLFQAGDRTVEYNITADGDGAVGVNAYDDGSEFGAFRKRMIDELLAVQHGNAFRAEYSLRLERAIENQRTFVAALATAPVLATEFSATPFSQSLRQIARVIGARDALGARRQTFFVQVGGWDHHDEVLNNQARMLPSISRGLREFRDALVELGVFADVTTFTTSDFGRTLTSNGKGSDHGWGGHHLAMGGSVAGGQMLGTYPTLAAGSPLDVGRGIYIPTTSVDSYFAELALWFGVAPSDLDLVLPNVRRFYAPESGAAPLGFLT
jgi:uncharacterized protein (DUF1501 family)